MSSLDFSNVLIRFQKECINLSENTLKSYERDLRQFIDFADSLNIQAWSNIDSKLAREYLSLRRRKGDKAVTIARKLSSLKKFFFMANKRRNRNSKPVYFIKGSKKRKKVA